MILAKTLRDGGHFLKGDQLEDQTWEKYTNLYIEEMRESYRTKRGFWDRLLKMNRVVLVCYCVEPLRCHRVLLANILVKCGATYAGEIGS